MRVVGYEASGTRDNIFPVKFAMSPYTTLDTNQVRTVCRSSLFYTRSDSASGAAQPLHNAVYKRHYAHVEHSHTFHPPH